MEDTAFHPQFEGHLDRCYFCEHVWGECTCEFPDPEDEDSPGFDFHDFFVTDPSMSLCGRFFVDPTVYYGQAYIDCALGDAWTHWPVKDLLKKG